MGYSGLVQVVQVAIMKMKENMPCATVVVGKQIRRTPKNLSAIKSKETKVTLMR
jgi:hypothetical protein